MRRFIEGDYAPVVVLAIVIAAPRWLHLLDPTTDYISRPSTSCRWLALVSALGFIHIGQAIALHGRPASICRWDPLAGILVVVASFFLVDGEARLHGAGIGRHGLGAAAVGASTED